MKLDAMVLGCLRGIGGASLLIVAAGCGSATPAAEPSTTPVTVAQPAPSPQSPQSPQTAQIQEPAPGQTQAEINAMAACGRG